MKAMSTFLTKEGGFFNMILRPRRKAQAAQQ